MSWDLKPLAKSQSALVGIDIDQAIPTRVTRQRGCMLLCWTHVGRIHDK